MESYKNLSSYILATVIFDLTVEFCRKFIDPRSRTTNQMTQAARSGKQNIAEGASVQSLESYIKLVGVAEGSQRELAADYEDFLRQKKLEIWDKEDSRVRKIREFRAVWLSTNLPNTPNLPNNPETAANTLLTFCQMETFLLKRQVEALKEKFVREGGFRENLFKERVSFRQTHPTNLTRLKSLILVFLGGLVLLGITTKPVSAVNSGQFTLSLWVNPSTSVASKALISKAEEFRVFTNANGFVGCQIKTSTWQTASQSTTKALVLGTWNLVLCTYDLTNLKVYVNGVQVATQALTSLPDDTSSLLRIGQDDSSSSFYSNLSGIIDEFKFYSYALTSDEVKVEYNHGSSLVLGSLSNTSLLTGGSVASNSASALFCVPGDNSACSAPVGEWNFEEGNGLYAQDTSGNNNLGTLGVGNSAPIWSQGKIGKALKFDGVNDYVGVANTISTKTVEFWVKPTTNTASMINLTATQYIAAASGTITATNFTSPIYYVNGQATASPTLSANVWNHIAVTTTSAISGNAITIGAANSAFTTGLIDQVKFFDYVRTPAQIALDYNKGDPVARWKFNECQGTVINDASGNSYTGTLTGGTPGTCTDATGTTLWNLGATGKYGASLKFDGTDYVNEPTSISGAQTVGFWVYPATTSQSFLQLSATGTITSSSGVVSAGAGFSSPSIYVNGILNGTVTASTWNHIVVTTATGITANAIKLGLVGASTYYSGLMDDVQIFNYALNSTQVKTLYNENSAVRFGP